MCQHFASTSHFDFKGVGWAYPKKVHGRFNHYSVFFGPKRFFDQNFWALFDATIHQVSKSVVRGCMHGFSKGVDLLSKTYVVFEIIFCQ